MSFSKSKVERFPCSTGIRTPTKEGVGPGPRSEILQEKKRLCMRSNFSSSMISMSSSSCHLTPCNKDNAKRKCSSMEESKFSNSTGSKKKAVERIPKLYLSRKKATISKPYNSPIYRGSLLKVKTAKKNETPPRKQLVTSGSKKVFNSKRKKVDETYDEIFSTPLTSSPRSDSDKSTGDLYSLANIQPESLEDTSTIKVSETEKQEVLTSKPFESTRPIEPSIPFVVASACDSTAVGVPTDNFRDEDTEDSKLFESTRPVEPYIPLVVASACKSTAVNLSTDNYPDENTEDFELFESTRPVEPSIPFVVASACKSTITAVDIPTDNFRDENQEVSDDSNSYSDNEKATVTTPRRNPSRKSFVGASSSLMEGSFTAGRLNLFEEVGRAPMGNISFPFPDDEHTSRIDPASQVDARWDDDSSLDFLNDAFMMQLTLQDTEQSDRFLRPPTNSQPSVWTFGDSHTASAIFNFRPSTSTALSSNAVGTGSIPHDRGDFRTNQRRIRRQSISCYNGNLDLTAETDEHLPAPTVQPPSFFDRIGSVVSTMFLKRTKRGENVSSAISSTAGLNAFTEQNYTEASIRERINFRQRRCSAFIPISWRTLFYRDTRRNVSSRELRRILRRIRIEARRTLREVDVCVIIPAKMYIKSPNFWMPVLEFVAGQAVEISLASLKVLTRFGE